MAIATAALLEDWEFDVGTRFAENLPESTDAHYSGILYAKCRLTENREGNRGFAITAWTCINPGQLEQGVVTDTFSSWWATGACTVPFLDGAVSLDLMPGLVWNRDLDNTDEEAWGFTWSARVAVCKIIPKWAIVGEAFGTTGGARADPRYNFGLRWESPGLIVAIT